MSERAFITIGGLHTAEIVLGEGVPVLMLHGWGASADLMLPLAQKLAPLGYRVCIPDLPGFGQTQPPPSPWGVGDYTNFTLGYLDAHGLKQVRLFGHSFGGRIGLMFGAEHPQRLMKMALANSAGVRPKPRGQTRLKAYKFAQTALRSVGLGKQAGDLRAWYADRYGSADYKAASGVMRETFVKVVNEDLLAYAARVAVPTLLLWGDQDTDTPLWYGQTLEKTIPDAGLVVFEGAGHYSYLDKLAETTRVVDYFFKQVS